MDEEEEEAGVQDERRNWKRRIERTGREEDKTKAEQKKTGLVERRDRQVSHDSHKSKGARAHHILRRVSSCFGRLRSFATNERTLKTKEKKMKEGRRNRQKGRKATFQARDDYLSPLSCVSPSFLAAADGLGHSRHMHTQQRETRRRPRRCENMRREVSRLGSASRRLPPRICPHSRWSSSGRPGTLTSPPGGHSFSRAPLPPVTHSNATTEDGDEEEEAQEECVDTYQMLCKSEERD